MASAYVTPFAGFAYHPHQLEGVKWMLNRERPGARMVRGGVLGDEMGLGKTAQTIGLLLNDPRVLSKMKKTTTLLLVPPVLLPQWGEALGKAGITYLVLQPPKGAKKGVALTAQEEADRWSWTKYEGARESLVVFLSTYVRASNHVDTLSTMPFDRLVCDEGHVFRNGYDTALFTKLIRIKATQRWILSGTPVQNDISDFSNLVKFLGMPAELRMATSTSDIAAEILLRRTVGDVREAVPTMPTEPPRHFVHPVSYPAGSEEEAVYNALVKRYENAQEAHLNKAIILELYLRICQFTTHPAIYVAALVAKYGDGYSRKTWTGTASKFTAFVDYMKTAPPAPTILFTTYKTEMDLAEEALTKLGYKCWKIQGGMSEKLRETVVADSKLYAETKSPKVAMLVQIVAGGAGLNLQHCSRVVFASSHWNPAVMDQAVARAYRMGQTARVEVHHFLMADDAALNMDRYKASMHGGKRLLAIAVHPKLYCDSAVSESHVLGELDDAVGVSHPVAVAVAGAGVPSVEEDPSTMKSEDPCV